VANFRGGDRGAKFIRKCCYKGLMPSVLKEKEKQVNTLATTRLELSK